MFLNIQYMLVYKTNQSENIPLRTQCWKPHSINVDSSRRWKRYWINDDSTPCRLLWKIIKSTLIQHCFNMHACWDAEIYLLSTVRATSILATSAVSFSTVQTTFPLSSTVGAGTRTNNAWELFKNECVLAKITEMHVSWIIEPMLHESRFLEDYWKSNFTNFTFPTNNFVP